MNNLYLPVLYNLKITSSYEYLEKRFDRKVRVFGTILFGINTMTWLAMVVYVSALTLNQVVGLNLHLVTPIICLVCICYTSLGGLKAVVWTDVVQAIIMLASLILVIIKGTTDAGGLAIILEKNLESGRIESPSLDLNPTSKYTIWSLSFGASIYFLLTTCIDQNMLQRYFTLPSLKSAKKAVWFFVLGYCIFVTLCCYSGLLLYATFYKCDPLQTQLVEKKDQLIPLLVMKVLKDYPGLSGIFVAGIVSAFLSSLSTGLNSMAAVIVEDIRSLYCRSLSETRSGQVIKLTIVVFGGLCVCLVYIVEQLGAILQVYMSVGAVTNGATLGLFTAGILFPWINRKGALVGGIASLASMMWICIKAQTAIASGELSYSHKSLPTEECPSYLLFNTSQIEFPANISTENNFKLYHVSYLWYTLMGTSVTVITGLLVSLVTKDSKKVNMNLLAPVFRKFSKYISSDESSEYKPAPTEERQVVDSLIL